MAGMAIMLLAVNYCITVRQGRTPVVSTWVFLGNGEEEEEEGIWH